MKSSHIFMFCAFFVLQSQQQKCYSRSGKSGSCLDLDKCTLLVTILNTTPNYLQFFLIIREYGCSLTENKLKVCCPNINTNDDSQEPPDVRNHPNLKLLPYECGLVHTNEKIIGGDKTRIDEFPWMARLLYNTSKEPEFKCGATVLNNNYLLTAAHCIKTNQLVGDHDFSTEKDCELDEENVEICLPPPQNLTIEEMIPHPDFNWTSRKNDIGLLRVSRMDFSNNSINAICMPLYETRTYNLTNKYGIVSGWGNTKKREPSPVLLKVTLPIISSVACNDIYADFAIIGNSQFCAGGKRRVDSCFGDSGGPLQHVYNLNNDVRFVQHGIVSSTKFDSCGLGYPGIFTKVTHFMDWILDTLNP